MFLKLDAQSLQGIAAGLPTVYSQFMRNWFACALHSTTVLPITEYLASSSASCAMSLTSDGPCSSQGESLAYLMSNWFAWLPSYYEVHSHTELPCIIEHMSHVPDLRWSLSKSR